MKKIIVLIFVLVALTAFSLNASEIYNQPFTSDLGDVDTVSVVGSQTWYWQSYDNGCATMSGYDGGQFENEDWLITPVLDLTYYTGVNLNFREAINYEDGSINDNEEILVSTDYSGSGDPNSANWTEQTVTGRASGGSWAFVPVDPVDLSAYEGESTVYIGYKYTSSDTNAGTWELGEIVVTGNSQGTPEITNVSHNPQNNITSSTTVSVSAQVTDPDGSITLVELHWGTSSDSLTNTINMSNMLGDTYQTDSDIPVQTDGTTVYYEVYAEDDDSPALSNTSAEYSYDVNDPATTTLPYSETFESNLDDCYTYSVSGDSKYWHWDTYSSNGFAEMNGYDSGDLETDWLILPGVNLDNYENEILTFETWYNFGTDSTYNYLKLFYSTDYTGIGDPGNATWDSLAFTRPGTAESWQSSGDIDLSGISGTSVYLGFKYNYESGMYRWWEVDNISITSGATMSVTPTELSGFSYIVGNGPSGEQTFAISGNYLSDDITITAPTNYEISETSGSGFGSSITLNQSGGSVVSTTIYVRLKAGLSIGDYNDEDITASTTGVDDKTVTCNGSVTEDTPDLMLSKIADPGDQYQARFVQLFNATDSTINFDSETWYLSKQANGGSWQEMQLSGMIESGDIFNIAKDSTVFVDSFGIEPELSNGNVINGNGDDGYFLFYNGDHSSGILVDAYGVIDVDGTGEPWEYEDSKAVRNAGTTQPNPTWTESEWTITAADVADCDPGTTNLGGTLPAPENVTIEMNSPTSGDVQVSWDEVAEANSYIIYRASQPYGTYAPVDTVSTTSFIDENVLSAFVDKLFYYVEASTDAN